MRLMDDNSFPTAGHFQHSYSLEKQTGAIIIYNNEQGFYNFKKLLFVQRLITQKNFLFII